MPQFIAVNPSVCTGCRECEVVCSLYHFGECNPEKAAIRVIRKEKGGLAVCMPLVCQQCEKAPCIEACPPEALSREGAESTLTVDEAKCSGCGDCVEACPAGCIFMDDERNIVISCDLCGGDPQCVTLCHSHCLTLAHGGTGEGGGVERLRSALEEEGLWDSVPGKGGR